MSKILLVDPPWYIFQGIKSDSVSLGITYLASVLKEEGHECLIFNGDFSTDTFSGSEGVLVNYDNYVQEITEKNSPVWKDFKTILNHFNPDYVGISILTPKYESAKEIARIVKDFNSKITIFVGGVHPTIQPVETVSEWLFDIVVQGEGEETVSELISILSSNGDLSHVLGIYYKRNGEIIKNNPRPLLTNIDTIPFPDFSLLYRYKEYPTHFFNRILTSRGCPYNCSYCASKSMWTRKVRFRSAEKVFEEIKYRYLKYGVSFFKFNDDTFTLNRQRLERLCSLILSENIKISWNCDTRADNLDESVLRLMKNAGCSQINMGVESGSERILKIIQKGESLDSIKSAFKFAKRLKIITLAYFMMGFPDETKDDVLLSINFMREIKPDIVCWSLFTPYPGTELYEHLIKNEYISKNPDWSSFFHHSPKMNFSYQITDEEWINLIGLVEIAIIENQDEINHKNRIRLHIQNLNNRLSNYWMEPSRIAHDFTKIPMIIRHKRRR